MSIARLYRLIEAKGRMISQAEAEKQFPDSTVYFDVDVPGGTATFSIDDGKLYANTKGQGWWVWDPQELAQRSGLDQLGKWVKSEKPAKERGGSGDVTSMGSHKDMRSGWHRRQRYEHVRPAYGAKPFVSLQKQGTNPKTATYFIDGGVLSVLFDDGAELHYDEKTDTWADPYGELNDGSCPVCGYTGSGQYPEQCPVCNNQDED